jgi:hypothetical protein
LIDASANRRTHLLGTSASFPPAAPTLPRRPFVDTAPLPTALSFTFPGASRLTGIGRSSLYALVKQGKLRKITVAGRSLIEGDSLRALIAGAPGGNARRAGPGRPRKTAA